MAGNNNNGDNGPSGPNSNVLLFSSCGGLENQINYIKLALIEPLRNQGSSNSQFKRFGLEAPKGILFYGPPGTGKTRLAQAIGNELKRVLGENVHFIYRKGQDVASKWFGKSSENLRAVFDEATQKQPSVLFFDELDGLCPSRDTTFMSQGSVTIVTTMLGLMDTLPKGKVFVIGATNRLEAIDPALRRPGRFDKHLEFLPPNEEGRFRILSIHTKTWKVKPTGELLRKMSKKSTGFSGADLAKLCLEAFNEAFKRSLPLKPGQLFSNIKMNNMEVQETDWNAAISKMKPSNSNAFGSTLYSHPQNLGDNVQQLLASNIASLSQNIAEMILSNNSNDGRINCLYVWSPDESNFGTVNDMMVSLALVNADTEKCPIYSLNPDVVFSVPGSKLPMQVNSVFSQALESPQLKSILYVGNVDAVWNLKKEFAKVNDMDKQLERLRGKSVLLLATGGTHPRDFSQHNPFKSVLLESSRTYQVEQATENERVEFFRTLFIEAVNLFDDSIDGFSTIDHLLDRVIEVTEKRSLGAIVTLHDKMQEKLSNNEARGMQIIDQIANIMSVFNLNK